MNDRRVIRLDPEDIYSEWNRIIERTRLDDVDHIEIVIVFKPQP